MMHHETLKEMTREAELRRRKEGEREGNLWTGRDVPMPKTSQMADDRPTD